MPTLATPGHTNGHVSYWLPEAEALFCGDTLFALGCGRLLEGDAPTMWRSLAQACRPARGDGVYCGHEYTQSNARFARTVDPDNRELGRRAGGGRRRCGRAANRRCPARSGSSGGPTLSCAPERPAIRGGRSGWGAKLPPTSAVFAELRRRKDRA